MSKNRPSIYQFLPQLFLRTPYYSFNEYDLSRLPEMLQDRVFRNALWLASPEFYRLLEKVNFNYDLLKNKEKHTLAKYYNRMCFRATPFGSFAAFTLLEWGNGEPVRIASKDDALLHLLPDQQLLNQSLTVSFDQARSGELILNPTLYRLGNVFRYIRSAPNASGRYIFTLEAISAAKFNTRLFAFLGNKRLPFGQVQQWVAREGACTDEEAIDYIRFLLESQLVFNENRGQVICADPWQNRPEWSGWDTFWQREVCGMTAGNFEMEEAHVKISHLTHSRSVSLQQPFYAATERPWISGGPDIAGQEELLKAVEILQLLNRNGQSQTLSRFIQDFRARFDLQKVPLLLALDSDAGLSYGELENTGPEPLEDIIFPETSVEEKRVGWNPVSQMLFRLWTGDSLRDSWSPVLITENDVWQLKSQFKTTQDDPQTLALLYRDTGEHLLIEQGGGVTATSLIGRFSVFSEQVHHFCRELAEQETQANPGVVFADIGQLSDTHVDNINRRKPIYRYEIPINVYSGQPQKAQIRPDDLLLSVRGNELILESVRLGKSVIPRLTTAYNFRNNNLPLFRLLCDLQFQGVNAGLGFDLESFFPGLSFYPRVAYGRTVLSPAKWKFKQADLEVIAGSEPAALMTVLMAFRQKNRIPRHISMGNYDQQLVFDLAQVSDARFFQECLAGQKNSVIQEYLMPDRSVNSGRKALAGQMVAFLSHEKEIFRTKGLPVTNQAKRQTRSFMLGSNWLYLKIFCTPRIADAILARVIFPFMASERKRLIGWFFIRYTSGGYHLRLRIEAAENELGTLLMALNHRMISGGFDQQVRDYQGDTYHREVERYGSRLIAPVEALFGAGSDLVAWVVRAREAGQPAWSEFELSLYTVNRMITCFLNDESLCLDFLQEVTGNFLAEFGADKQLKIGLDNKYRKSRSMVATLLATRVKWKRLTGLIKHLNGLKLLTADDPQQKRRALLADLVHMQLNRTFSTKQRQQELLVYYCLKKHTESAIARKLPAVHSP